MAQLKTDNGWAEETIQKVWEKGEVVPGNDPALWRKDAAGAWIRRDKYGDCSSETGFGWEIDHIMPLSAGGKSELNNLRPLQWRNNRAKGDNYPKWTPAVKSDGYGHNKLV